MHLGLSELPLTLPSLPDDVPLIDGLFDLDSDKVLYVQLLSDPMTKYRADEIFGSWDAEDLGIALETRRCAVEQYVFERHSAPNEIMTLTVLGGVGRRLVMGIGSKNDPSPPLQLAIPAHDLETITTLESGNRLALLQFARAYQAIRNRTEVSASSILDEYEIYRVNNHSYYLRDDALPTLMSIAPGNAGSARREAVRERDTHGVRASLSHHVIEVMCLYESEVPIYVPSVIDPERLELLVESIPVPTWVIAPNLQRVAPNLRPIYFEIAQTIAYWLWQCSPWIKDSFDWEGAQTPLRFEIYLNGDGDWSQVLSEPPAPISESILFSISEPRRRIRLEFNAGVMSHFSGSDNNGE